MNLKEKSYINLEIKNKIAIVTLNRVDKKNCLNVNMRIKIGEIFEEISKMSDVKAVLVTGAGNNFCAGGDVHEMTFIKSSYEAQALSQIEQNAFYHVQTCKKPVIAAIDGCCFGAGFDLALSCDFRFITKNTKMGFPEVKLGIIVGGGGINKLVNHVGLTFAKELLFTGMTMNAEDIIEKNIGNIIHDNDKSYAGMFSECISIGECFKNHNREEGIDAFVKKRKANFE